MTAPINQLGSQGKRHGVWEGYWGDGTLRWRGHYHHGQEHGLWSWHNKDGIADWKRYYLNIK